jgi:adenylyltransferase/sulfurtransferase
VACGQSRVLFLDNLSFARSATLCGRDAIQIRPARDAEIDLPAMARRLSTLGETHQTPYLVRCTLREPADVRVTVFGDGRAIVHGVREIDRARAIYARFIGN